MEPIVARKLWQDLETLNAVTYFTAECREAPAQLGLKGFWMGYFGCRAAPMGPVPPGVVEATFFNFHPARVQRAIPDAWSFAKPGDILATRSAAAATALRRLLEPDGEGDAAEDADRLAAETLPLLRKAVDQADGAGRPLFAANRDLDPPADPVEELWQRATTLREHRGDGHVALLTGAGLSGCEVHVLMAAARGMDRELFERSRGWSAEDWQVAVERLAAGGLVDDRDDGLTLTPAGRDLRDSIEQRTDELALPPYASLGAPDVEALGRLLHPAAQRIASSGELSYPNPMGLPPPEPLSS